MNPCFIGRFCNYLKGLTVAQAQGEQPARGRPQWLDNIVPTVKKYAKLFAGRYAWHIKILHYLATASGSIVVSIVVVSLFIRQDFGSLAFLLDASRGVPLLDKSVPERVASIAFFVPSAVACTMFLLPSSSSTGRCQAGVEQSELQVVLLCGAVAGVVIFVASLFA